MLPPTTGCAPTRTPNPCDRVGGVIHWLPRVYFNWDRFHRDEWAVSLAVEEDFEKLGGWRLPWHFCDGRFCSFQDDRARPAAISEIPVFLNGLEPDRRCRLDALATEYRFAARTSPVQIVAATYQWNGLDRFVLDGSHRLAALSLAAVQFKVLVFEIAGPLDPEVIPDLKYWRTFGSSSEARI